MSIGTAAFEKRLRRRIIGREHDFYAVVAPGLEGLCAAELAALGVPADRVRPAPGGVEFTGRLPLLYAANLHLRTAGRILMPIAGFTAAGFTRLAAAADAVDWDLYLAPGRPPAIYVTTRQCRLYHKGAVAERLQQAIARRLPPGGAPAAPGRPQRLFVRGVGDRFTVSLDSSGPLLHKRGAKPVVGPAPLRETLAAAALMLAGHVPGTPLVDPMCGSGSFSLEAAMMAAGMPAGWHREFAFEGWPCFSAPAWGHIRKTAAQRMAAAAAHPRVFASDIRADAVAAVAPAAERMGVSGWMALAVRDFFCVEGARVPGGPGTVVLNPPYGLRLGRPAAAREDYPRIRDHLRRAFAGWRAAIFCPAQAAAVFSGLRLTEILIAHGGLRLALLTGRVPA